MKPRFLTLLAFSVLSFACSSEDKRPPAVNPNVDATTDVWYPELGAPDTGSDATDATDATDAADATATADTADTAVAADTADTAVADAVDADAVVDTGPPATCFNMTKDGTETDEDCGGDICPTRCAVSKQCTKDSDCVEKRCNTTLRVCNAPSCGDGAHNGLETDVDCGGPSCPKCTDTKKCGNPSDCQSGVCLAGFCAAPTCTDGVRNGTESDIDCGGPCAKKCNIGDRCNGAGDCVSNTCLNPDMSGNRCQCPSGMTRINVPSAGGTYCMDQAEVTNEQYAKLFLSTGPSTSGQPAECSWNSDYVPVIDWPAPETRFGFPVRGVDWCDALAYCKKQGKSLCGKIGGGPTPVASYDDNNVSKWDNACSQGPNAYPYSIATYDPAKCNGAGYWTSMDAGSSASVYQVLVNGTTTAFDPTRFVNKACIGGPLSDIYQLSGNVTEWEDACTGSAGSTDKCLVRGGSFKSDATGLRCDAKREENRNTKSDEIGFRCCL